MNIAQFFTDYGQALSAAGGTALANMAYQRLEDVGEQAILGTTLPDGTYVPGAFEFAQMGLNQSQFQPYTVRSTTGGVFGVTPDQYGNLQAAYGLSPEEAALQNSLMGGASSMFQQAMAPTAGREMDVYNRIRAVQQPEEQRQALMLEERLANQGRLGVRSNLFGGTPEQLALSKAQSEAQNQAALMAMQQAQAEQMQQSQLGQQFLAGAYMPQAQLMNVQQVSQLYPQLAQKGQLYGAGLFGEAAMGGLNALLGSALGQANLMGTVGGGLLTGAFS